MLLASLGSNAQVSFFYNESALAINKTSVLLYIDSSVDRTLTRYEQVKHQLRPISETNANLSYKNEMLWMKIPLSAVAGLKGIEYVMIRNPHINYVCAWLVKGDSIVQAFPPTGDHLVFNSRLLSYADFVFPVHTANAQNLSVLLLIDKRNEQLNIPVHFLTVEGFTKYNRFKNLVTGLMMGIGFFLILFSVFLFYQMRERLYIFYALYIALVFFYIFSDYGYSFMYLFPNHPFPADFTRPMAISFATPVYMLFALSLLNVRKQLPHYYKWSIRYLAVYFIMLITAIFLMPDTGPFRSILVWIMQIYQNLSAVWMIIIAATGIRKKIPYSAYILSSAIILLLSFFFFMQYLSGYIADTIVTRNMMNIGFTSEICLLAFVLTLRFKNYKEQSEQLLRNSNLQQEQIFKTISDYQEQEMQRYSSLLHDSVGAQLSAIRLNLESVQHNQSNPLIHEKLEQSIDHVSRLADDVRQFSHTLSPVLLQQKGLVDAIKQIVADVNKSSTLYIQFESIGSRQQVSFRYELLIYNILQELIQNIIKHAGASEAIIQLMLEKEMISVFVEDNGISFDQPLKQDGLGFSQIKQLVTFVKGTLSIQSSINKGCTVSIEFPVLTDETNQPHPYS